MLDSYYTLIPIDTNPEDWIHIEQPGLPLEKSQEIQEFIMGRISNMFTKVAKNEYDSEKDEFVKIEQGIIIYNNSINKRILNGYVIGEIDLNLMWEWGDYIIEGTLINGCLLLSRDELIKYIADNQEIIWLI